MALDHRLSSRAAIGPLVWKADTLIVFYHKEEKKLVGQQQNLKEVKAKLREEDAQMYIKYIFFYFAMIVHLYALL